MTTNGFLKDWHSVVAARDLDALGGFLGDKIRLGSPPYCQKPRAPKGRSVVGAAGFEPATSCSRSKFRRVSG